MSQGEPTLFILFLYFFILRLPFLFTCSFRRHFESFDTKWQEKKKTCTQVLKVKHYTKCHLKAQATFSNKKNHILRLLYHSVITYPQSIYWSRRISLRPWIWRMTWCGLLSFPFWMRERSYFRLWIVSSSVSFFWFAWTNGVELSYYRHCTINKHCAQTWTSVLWDCVYFFTLWIIAPHSFVDFHCAKCAYHD